MVEGPNPSGSKPPLRVIEGEKRLEKPRQAKFFEEVEPLVQNALRDVRRGRTDDGRLIGYREKLDTLYLLALIRDEVGGEVLPILREAALVADSCEDRLFAARLMIQVADLFRDAGINPWPVMDMAFTCAQESPDGREKEEALVDVAYAYCVLGDFARAERIMDNLASFDLRQELKKTIEEFLSLVQPEE